MVNWRTVRAFGSGGGSARGCFAPLLPGVTFLGVACVGSALACASAASGGVAGAPVAAPHPTVTGCVESRELRAFVEALDAHRQSARRAVLAELGAEPEERRGAFGDAGMAPALDSTLEAGGRRFGVVARYAPHFEPTVSLAKTGNELHRIDERPRAHAVPVLVCGVRRCPRPSPPRSAPRGRAAEATRPVLIELGPSEGLGAALGVAYDYWWADVSYDRAEPCGPVTPAEVPPPSAARATP
jgi:hypothetical protein